jgi:hypothetical protein
MITKRMEKEINTQINKEFYSAYPIWRWPPIAISSACPAANTGFVYSTAKRSSI